MRLKNTNPLGEVELPLIGRVLAAGEEFDVDDEHGRRLLEQAGNYEKVTAAKAPAKKATSRSAAAKKAAATRKAKVEEAEKSGPPLPPDPAPNPVPAPAAASEDHPVPDQPNDDTAKDDAK